MRIKKHERFPYVSRFYHSDLLVTLEVVVTNLFHFCDDFAALQNKWLGSHWKSKHLDKKILIEVDNLVLVLKELCYTR
jgi:hypothetical protein